MGLLDGFVAAVLLQLWQQYVPEAAKVILSMTALRVVLPMAVTGGAVNLLHRLDARWHPQ